MWVSPKHNVVLGAKWRLRSSFVCAQKSLEQPWHQTCVGAVVSWQISFKTGEDSSVRKLALNAVARKSHSNKNAVGAFADHHRSSGLVQPPSEATPDRKVRWVPTLAMTMAKALPVLASALSAELGWWQAPRLRERQQPDFVFSVVGAATRVHGKPQRACCRLDRESMHRSNGRGIRAEGLAYPHMFHHLPTR